LLPYLKYGVLCAFLCVWFCVFQEINTDDETWFLQVINRVLSGDVLYRDVFLGVTPLSVYIPAFFCWIFGSELLVVRLVHALYFVVGIFLSCGILKELKVSSWLSSLFILSFFVFVHSQSAWGFSGYNALATGFFLACFYFTLRWINGFSIWQLALAAVMTGLCFCAKQNVGALAFICLLVIFPWKKPMEDWLREKIRARENHAPKKGFKFFLFLNLSKQYTIPIKMKGILIILWISLGRGKELRRDPIKKTHKTIDPVSFLK